MSVGGGVINRSKMCILNGYQTQPGSLAFSSQNSPRLLVNAALFIRSRHAGLDTLRLVTVTAGLIVM